MNEQPDDETHAFRQIVRAFRDKQQNKGAETFAVDSLSRVTVHLSDYTVDVRTELALALKEIDSPKTLDLIRQCPICTHLFWAGRVEKEACDKHAEQWRKRQRRNQKARKAEAEVERRDAQRRKALSRLSKTAHAVIRAIMADQRRLFYTIDNSAASYLHGTVLRVPSSRIVRNTLTMLVRVGYLSHHPYVSPSEDRYAPEQPLIDLWNEMHGKPNE